MHRAIPVTLLTGNQDNHGAQLLERIQNDLDTERVTAIVPWKRKKKSKAKVGFSVVHTTERFQRLGQGCACCTVRSDVMTKIRRIADEQTADRIFIFVSPNSDLTILEKTFSVADADGALLSDVAELGDVSTIVDAGSFLSTLRTSAARPIIERLEQAKVALLDGAGKLSESVYAQVVSAISAINQKIQIRDIKGNEILLSSLQSKTLSGAETGQGEGPNHSGFQAVTRFTFESKAPFHPGRLHALIKQKLASVIRLKGTFWVASRPELVGDLDIAGGNTAVSCAGHWWASVPPEERPKNPAFRAYLESTWHPQFGDRNQDLTLAGVGLNEAELRQALNACLLTDDELAEPENWMRYNDPFKWPKR